MYVRHCSLEEIEDFLDKANARFMTPVAEDDYDNLLDMIDYLKQVRDRTYEIDDAFEPLKVKNFPSLRASFK